MMNIKDYIMNEARSVISSSNHVFGYFEVVEENRIISCGPLTLNFKVGEVENKTEQEIKRLIADTIFITTYISITVPDIAKVYLYIEGKQYLIENEYRPELYY